MDNITIIFSSQVLNFILLVLLYIKVSIKQKDSPDVLIAREKAKLELEEARAESKAKAEQRALDKLEEEKLSQEASEIGKGF